MTTNIQPPPNISAPPIIRTQMSQEQDRTTVIPKPIPQPAINPIVNLRPEIPQNNQSIPAKIIPQIEDKLERTNKSGQARIEALVSESDDLKNEILKLFKSKTILTHATKGLLEKKFSDYADLHLATINEMMNVILDDLSDSEK